jgi:hypothetical protein
MGGKRREVLNRKKSFETHSLPTLTRSYLRPSIFYVADPSAPFDAFHPRTADGSFVSPLICGLFKTPSHI